jgi:hypothetical protein
MSSLGGMGLPPTGINTRPTRHSLSGLMSGLGTDGQFSMLDAGGTSSSMNQISNPRPQIQTQYMIDHDTTNFEADLGNMELHYMDVKSGPVGIHGQDKPYNLRASRA